MKSLSRIGDWLDERIGHRALWRGFADEPVPGGARFAYVFGSLLVFLFVLQTITGILLASYYAPSATDAWASVAYIQQEVSLGWLVRGLHSTGASAMVIAMVAHLAQVTLWGAYRKPREVNWWLGLTLAVCVFGFALTGYLLPWDQKGYWATQVATSMVGLTPLVGPWLKQLIQGGPEYGNLTLTRFYALHAIVLPLSTVLLIAAHVALFRKHGVTPSWRMSDSELTARTVRFWPHQLLRDLLVMVVALDIMIALVARTHGVSLEAPADPASAYDARPEWYFYPLFELLKFFPGRLEIVAAIGAPLLAGGILFLLPLVDRGPSRNPAARKMFVGAVAILLFGTTALGVAGAEADRRNAGYQKFRVAADARSARALELAKQGVPPEGGVAVFDNDPLARGRKIFAARCSGCHVLDGAGERRAPDLDGWSSRAWLRAFLKDPEGDHFFGKTKIRGMKPVKAEGADFEALVEFVFQQGDAKLHEAGANIFAAQQCDVCHETDGKTAGEEGAPNLGGRATQTWLKEFLLDPSEPRFFGAKNQMPKMRGKLSDVELDAVVTLLRAERAK